MNVRFDHAKDEAPNIRTYYFLTDDTMRFTAGQFTELTLPHKNPDARGIKRWFTISSSPSEQFISITTRHATDQGSSFKKALHSLEPGTEVQLAAPMGDFVLPKDVRIPLIFVAGGIGVTPFHSMLTWMHATKEQRPIHFLYAVDREEHILFEDTFRAVHQHVSVIVSSPSREWGGLSGKLDADRIVEIANPTPTTLIYLSGPETMTEELTKHLRSGGISRDNLITDYFPGYTAL